MKKLPPAIFLMGPTASGKTNVAVELVQRLPLEIISVDSALVYRDMNIGTAKPDAATLVLAPHHLIDIIDPTDVYSAAAFRHDALRLMADISARGKIPLLVGGTMLYFKALREGLSALPQADAAVRAELDAMIAEHGIEYLHARLAEVDPETAARLHATDTQRIQRAMEIYRITGQPMSALLTKPFASVHSPASGITSDLAALPPSRMASGSIRGLGRGESLDESPPLPQPLSHECERRAGALPYRVISIALIPGDRSALHQHIAIRFQQMLKQGLLEELRMLREKYPLHPDLPSMRCVGYRQSWQFLEGDITEAQLLETGIAATRQLAKRQLTWLRSMPDNIELDCLTPDLERTVFDIVTKNI